MKVLFIYHLCVLDKKLSTEIQAYTKIIQPDVCVGVNNWYFIPRAEHKIEYAWNTETARLFRPNRDNKVRTDII
jgi:hypothetical protein